MNKKKKILQSLAMILTTAMTLQPVDAKKVTKESILEEAKIEAENGNVEIGKTTYKRGPKKDMKKQEIKAIDVKLKDIVIVNGRGIASSDGTGLRTRKYIEEKMAVVGVKKDKKYPYALAPIKEDGSLEDVIGWFKEKDITAKLQIIKTTDYAPVIKQIVNIEDVAIKMNIEEKEEETTNLGIPISSGYEWLGKEHAIKVYYDFPKPKSSYDNFLIKDLKDSIEAHIYQNEQQKLTYYCDRIDGRYWYFKEERKQVKTNKKSLKNRYGIRNS